MSQPPKEPVAEAASESSSTAGRQVSDDRKTEAVASGERKAWVRRFRLVVLSGADAGAHFSSRGERSVIGTHELADLLLLDKTVSRFHCEIVVSEGRAMIRDLGSRNGTAVNGVSIAQAYLQSGATLKLGRTSIRFELDTEHVQIPMSEGERFGLLVGRSPAMRAIFSVFDRVAASDTTVLLIGETGTGKEVAAESLHRSSARANGPFVVVDCGAIPAHLLESELFGHRRGSFTGALTDRKGAFEDASRGTLFLDEVGELAGDLQPKLLRALDRREIKPIGSNTYVPIDVRIIAATNRHLRAEVNEGQFRSDLYYRLAVLEVQLPPLRERPMDLPLLVDDFLKSVGAEEGEQQAWLRSTDFAAELGRHSWPGNVRELRNYLERCMVLNEEAALAPNAQASEVHADAGSPFRAAREKWTRVFERDYLEALLQRHDGNVSAAARAAEVDRNYFYRLLWRHGLR